MPYRAVRDPDRLHSLLDSVLAVDADLDPHGVLQRLVERARSLTGARYGALGVLDPTGTVLSEFVFSGIDEAQAARIGAFPQGLGILGLLVIDPAPLRLDDLTAHPDAAGFPPGHPPMRSFLGVPVRVGGAVYGNLYLTEKDGGAGFTEDDEALVVALAAAAGAVVDKARLLTRVSELTRVAERERVARDLHDTVIQRLFAAGLSVESSVPLVGDEAVRRRLEEVVAELDEIILQVRTTIFELSEPPRDGPAVRARVLAVCSEAVRQLGYEPDVAFAGPVDRLVPDVVSGDLLLALREALANVARHAWARRVGVEVAVTGSPGGGEAKGGAGQWWLQLRVADDGVGPREGAPAPDGDAAAGPVEGPLLAGRGLQRLERRVRNLGGRLELTTGPTGGGELWWEVPLPDVEDAGE